MPSVFSLALLLGTLAQAAGQVAILKSDELPVYDAPIESFRAAVGQPVTIHQLKGDKERARRIAADLSADPPIAVLALGAKAAWIAQNDLPNTIPVVYAQVRDPDRYGLDGVHLTGVRMEMPPAMVLAQFRLLAPDVQSIAILVSASNKDPAIAEAIAAAKAVGLTVKAQRVTSERDARRTAAQIAARTDAIWLLPDPVVLTPGTFQFVRQQAVRNRIPLLAYSEALVDAGALLCVAPDPEAIGVQAAELVLRILAENVTPGVIEPVAPRQARVVLNADVQESIGLRIDPMLLDFVDQTVRDKSNR